LRLEKKVNILRFLEKYFKSCIEDSFIVPVRI
jgi:hypothetical protein